MSLILRVYGKQREHEEITREEKKSLMDSPKSGHEFIEGRESYLQKVLVKKSERIILVDLQDVFWIESSGNYIELNLSEKSHLIRGTLKQLEKRLNPHHFKRIHKSSIVNFGKVKFIEPNYAGDFDIVLENDKKIKMSRSYKNVLDNFKIN